VTDIPVQTARVYRAANAWVWAARGRWDSALATMSAVAAEDPELKGINPPLVLQEHGMAVLAAVLGAVDPTVALKRRVPAVALLKRIPDEEGRRFVSARLAWLDGLLSLARGDRAGVERARGDLAGNTWMGTDLVDRTLATYERALAGDRKRAGRDLADLEDDCLRRQDCVSVVPHIALQRFLAAQWLAEAGEVERAARLLRWQDADWYDWSWVTSDALGGPAFLVRARLEEGRGDTRRAREYYQQFLRRYDQPMASQAHLVEEARSALTRLGGDSPDAAIR
jgi:tetratricopeptide (TPR) repeat protein